MTAPIKTQDFLPGRVWSLLDVLKLFATSFIALGEAIGSADLQMAIFQEPFLDSDGRLQQPGRPHDAEVALKAVVQVAERLELPLSVELIQHALDSGQPQTHGEWALLRKALYTEIKNKALFFIPAERVKYWDHPELVSPDTTKALPTATAELIEAGSCYAAGRFTATVFHSMRAAEVGLKALAKACGVPDQNDWGSYIREIDKELTRRMKSAGARAPDEQFYSELSAHFDNLKRAWRNPTMHVDRTYLDGQARAILDATIVFVEHLPPRISE